MTRLFLFQIGPVQTFIAQARRTQDLYVGSRILSGIASAGIQAAEANKAELIYPVRLDDTGLLPQSVPHRFAFLANGESIGEAVAEAMKQRWRRNYAGKVRAWLIEKIGDAAFYERSDPTPEKDRVRQWTQVFDRQIQNWLEIYWVALPYDDGRHKEIFRDAGATLNARKNARHFPQASEPGRKCTLTGAGTALPIHWPTLRGHSDINDVRGIILRNNEALGAVAAVKRFAQNAGCDLGITEETYRRFPSTDDIAGLSREDRSLAQEGKLVDAYLAVLHMDGDRMGEYLGRLPSNDKHQAFSQKLAQFADKDVPAIVQSFDTDPALGQPRAALVYAGGDDVLALLPLSKALACADALQKRFREITDLTISGGIATAPYILPLDAALEMVREAEQIAKDQYRDQKNGAVVVRETHRSGQFREAGAKWYLIPNVETIQSRFMAKALSGKLGFDLLELAHDLTDDALKDARRAEVGRLVKRRVSDQLDDSTRKALVNELQTHVVAMGEDPQCGWESVANWVILARFLAQGERQ